VTINLESKYYDGVYLCYFVWFCDHTLTLPNHRTPCCAFGTIKKPSTNGVSSGLSTIFELMKKFEFMVIFVIGIN